MRVSSGRSFWVIPPHFGLWMPARIPHGIHMPEPVSMRTLYLRPGLVTALPPASVVLHISPLLRELIFESMRTGRLRARNRSECALRDLLIWELERASSVPAFVALPRDERALAVAQATIADPAGRVPLRALCAHAGVSVRTLQRVFRPALGLNFESSRRQVRLMKAVELLVSNVSVKQAAFAVGYRQPGALVVLFRTTFGATPKAWISGLARLDARPSKRRSSRSVARRPGSVLA